MSLMSKGRLESRYRFTGRLEFTDPVHVGSGFGDDQTDSTVVRAGTTPIIPGSSIRGAFRVRVERIYGALSPRKCCGLYDRDDTFPCATVNQTLRDKLEEKAKGNVPPTPQQWLSELDGNLCDVCKLFGCGALWSSKITFTEAKPVAAIRGREIRHGVGISRQTGAAAEGIKFDQEILPAGTSFGFEAILESPTPTDLSLVALGLDQLVRGEISIGGKMGVGLGCCRLVDGQVFHVNFADRQSVIRYLRDRKEQLQPLSQFTNQHLSKLWEG
jgi:CRISPR-associated RAMP protein (TIGR02581 family)